MSFARYQSYKDSAVEWLDKVPAHWDVTPLKYVASLKGRLGWQGLRAEEYTEDGPFLVTSEHFVNEAVDWTRCYHVAPERYAIAPEIQLRPEDVLLMKDGAAMGKLAYVDFTPGPACLNSHLLLFRPVSGRFANRFLFYVLGGLGFRAYMEQKKTGTTFFGISQESIGSFVLALPPVHEQVLILRFLHRETSKIDALVTEQKRLIALLKEKRQAIISHAVAKGLNPAAPMKDSGIEWLGKVPEHWDVGPVKFLIQPIEQGWSPQCEGYQAAIDGEWGVLKVGCVNGGRFDPNENKALPADLEPIPALGIAKGDILISRANTRELVGSVAVAEDDHPQLMLCDKLYRLRPIPGRCLARFMALNLSTSAVRGQIELAATGASSSMLNIAQSTVLNLAMCVPPINEQSEIIAFLNRGTAKLSALIAEAERAITLLQERRTALISAAVTGKIDLRGIASTGAVA